MDSMVGTALAIEREMEDARGIRDASAFGKRKEDHPSSTLGKRHKTSVPRAPQGFGPAQSQLSVGQAQTQFIPPHPSMG